MMESYFRRWEIEETIRYIKTVYGLENVQVLRYRALQNLMPIMLAATYYAAVELHIGERFKIMVGHIFRVAKRIFGIPSSKRYAVADGLKCLFQQTSRMPKAILKKAVSRGANALLSYRTRISIYQLREIHKNWGGMSM
jgi:hypothetical protein